MTNQHTHKTVLTELHSWASMLDKKETVERSREIVRREIGIRNRNTTTHNQDVVQFVFNSLYHSLKRTGRCRGSGEVVVVDVIELLLFFFLMMISSLSVCRNPQNEMHKTCVLYGLSQRSCINRIQWCCQGSGKEELP